MKRWLVLIALCIAIPASAEIQATGDCVQTITCGEIAEADGDTYTGTHDFSGATVTVQATTGDSATAFFGAGTIEHERGGLQADLSAYTGLIAITGVDTTAEVDAKSELEAQIADVADFAEADGDAYTGTHDFSGATALRLPVVTDCPSTCTVGDILLDSDGDTDTDQDCAGDASPHLCVCQATNTWYGIDLVP